MALIKCPECKKKISDQCGNCPNCGYPIKANITTGDTEAFEKSNLLNSNTNKPFFKKWWFWTVVGVVLTAIVLSVVWFINRDTKPKLDEDGKPAFIELTNEVYTNADKYKGYHINIKGKVFQVIGDNGTNKGIQVWLDPETCEQNLMIYYSTDVDVKQGDFISCSGYIDSVTKYKNAYDAELYVPLIFSTDLKKATYIDVMAPTTETITLNELKKESHGYAIAIDKVEFSEKETRVYVSVTNNGKATMYIGNSVIIQAGKQYKSTTNYEADYEEIPYEILKGASSSGIIVFPAITSEDFELSFEVHSDDFDENLGEYAFEISKEDSTVKKPEAPTEIITPENLKQEKYGYSITIDKIEFYNEETRIYLTVANRGKTLLYVDSDSSVILQEGNQYNTTHNYTADYDELPYEIIKGATVSGVIAFPQLSSNDFELTIYLHSDEYDEEFEKFIFKISKNPVAPPTTEPPTQDENNTNIPPITTQPNKDRKQEAIAEAVNQANRWFPIDRHFIEYILVNPSLKEGFEPYTEEEAAYAIANANIDWKEHALYNAIEVLEANPGIDFSQQDVRDFVENSGGYCGCAGYTDEEIQYAVDNCGIDWDKPANTPPNNRDEAAIEEARWMAYYDYTATPADIHQRLMNELGFSSEDAWYCVGKVTSDLLDGSYYNWAERVEYYVTYELQDYYIEYTWCYTCEEVYGVHETCPICGSMGTQTGQLAFGYTRAEVVSKLKNEGFSDSDIQIGLSNIPNNKFYDESIYKKP